MPVCAMLLLFESMMLCLQVVLFHLVLHQCGTAPSGIVRSCFLSSIRPVPGCIIHAIKHPCQILHVYFIEVTGWVGISDLDFKSDTIEPL